MQNIPLFLRLCVVELRRGSGSYEYDCTAAVRFEQEGLCFHTLLPVAAWLLIVSLYYLAGKLRDMSDPSASGRCANCGKEAIIGQQSLKNCTGCRLTSYCSKECQRLHWKVHKEACRSTTSISSLHSDGKPAATDASADDDVRLPLFTVATSGNVNVVTAGSATNTIDPQVAAGVDKKKIDTHFKATASCQNCLLSITLKQPMVCGRCKNATYCSRPCQKEHWKNHQMACAAHVATIQEGKDTTSSEQQSAMTMFDEWKRRARGVLHAVIKHALSPQLFEQQPPTHVVVMDCKFHYNLLTFYPSSRPTCVAIDDLRVTLVGDTKNYSAMLAQAYNTTKAAAQRSTTEVERIRHSKIHFLLLFLDQGDRFLSMIPTIVGPELQRHSWNAIENLFANDVRCPRQSGFDNWRVTGQLTLKKQLDILQSPEHVAVWAEFVHSVYRCMSNKPRHLTHAALIEFDFDFGLGKVARLCQYNGYRVIPLQKARDMIQAAGRGADGGTTTSSQAMTAMAAQQIVDNVLSAERSPTLRQSQYFAASRFLQPRHEGAAFCADHGGTQSGHL